MKVERELATLNPTTLCDLLLSPEANMGTSHLLVLTEPSPTFHFKLQKRVVTTHVFTLFWERHQPNQEHEMARFYDLLWGSPFSSVVSGMVFKVRLHQKLKDDITLTLTLTPILCHTVPQNIIYDNCLDMANPGTMQIALGPLEAVLLTDGITLLPGCYYNPQASNFPSIAAVVLHPSINNRPPILVMFQIFQGVFWTKLAK